MIACFDAGSTSSYNVMGLTWGAMLDDVHVHVAACLCLQPQAYPIMKNRRELKAHTVMDDTAAITAFRSAAVIKFPA